MVRSYVIGPGGVLPRWALRLPVWVLAALLAACSTTPRQVAAPPEPVVPIAPAAPMALPEPASPPVVVPESAPTQPLRSASAATPRDYRRYGAAHIYARHADRIYAGQLPPLLYAVGVLNVDIDAMGQVRGLDWMRAPRHAPEVMAEIERMVRAAAPFPAPSRMGRVTWTDIWLWDKSGRFQIDTLTEGQMSRLPVSAPATKPQTKRRAAPKPKARPKPPAGDAPQ